MKIAVFCLGYVALFNAVLLAQQNHVAAADSSSERVEMLNVPQTPIVYTELGVFFTNGALDFTAAPEAAEALAGADCVIFATLSNYDIGTNNFDTFVTSEIPDVKDKVFTRYLFVSN